MKNIGWRGGLLAFALLGVCLGEPSEDGAQAELRASQPVGRTTSAVEAGLSSREIKNDFWIRLV